MTSDVAAAQRAGMALVAVLSGALDRDRLRVGVPLAPLTTFRIGGPADVLYDAMSADDLANAVMAARAAGIPWMVLGLGANILVADRGIRGLVIRSAQGRIVVNDTLVRADAGVIVGTLIEETARLGLSGLEHYVGIPSSVGGALWQNLHFLSPAPARERTMFIAEVVDSVELLLPDGSRITVGASEMRFGYDTSRLHGSGEIALSATFRLVPASPERIGRTMRENLRWRAERHPPLDRLPSAGSVFRKIDGVGAGRLIDQCGLKGARVGAAQVSEQHANFIVNLGGATASDVRALVALVQERVRNELGHELQPEIAFLGEF